MPDHSDDLHRFLAIRKSDALTNGVCVWKMLARKNIVDDQNRRSSYLILGRKKAASLQRDSQGRQIAGFDPVHQGRVHLAFARRPWLSIEPESQVFDALQGPGTQQERSRAYIGHRTQRLTQLA